MSKSKFRKISELSPHTWNNDRYFVTVYGFRVQRFGVHIKSEPVNAYGFSKRQTVTVLQTTFARLLAADPKNLDMVRMGEILAGEKMVDANIER